MATENVNYYHEISIRIPSAEVEPVANYIIENICGGLLLEDEDEDSQTTVKFYIADGIDIETGLSGLKKYVTSINSDYADIPLRQKRIKDLDWIEAYKKSVVPVLIGDSIVIKPPWNDETWPGRTEIMIEPKMAFGTGRHESTQGSLSELGKIDLSNKTLLDLGCGSGVLSIYAAKRGAAKVLGYDIDPLAVENSIENFDINDVESVCSAEIGSIENLPVDRWFDVIVVNIIKSVIIPIIGILKDRLVPGGVMILAGLLEQDRREVESALIENNLTSFEIRIDKEWVSYAVRRT